MRDHEQKYYLCKSGEVKRRAEEHRATYKRHMDKLWKVVNSFGSDTARIEKRMLLIEGIAFKGEPPKGWTKPKYGISRPKLGTLKPEVRRCFTPSGSYFVETHKDLKPFQEWLGCPFHYSYKTKTGSGTSTIGRLFSEGFVYWYSETGPILLELPDVAGAKKEALASGETIDNNVLDWVPPKGLKEILPEEWDLMVAKHKRKEAK